MQGKQIILSLPFFFLFSPPSSSSQYVSLGERVCLQSVVLGRIKTAVHPTMFSFKRLLSQWMVPLVKSVA